MSTIKRICICAICIAMCYVLPLALHPFGLGQVLSPMHLPVLLCGLICGWGYGALCGVLGPIVSSLLSSMPSATALISMIPELCVYGLVSGLLMKLIRTRRPALDLYAAMLPAMLLGRVVGGLAKVLFYASGVLDSGLTLAAWVSAYFVASWPGIVLQLVLLPLLYFVLEKSRLIPQRYPKEALRHG